MQVAEKQVLRSKSGDLYEMVVGLEVHAQLKTKSKMYAPDAVTYGERPNAITSPITLGHPGTLPRVNAQAIQYAVKMGLATDCTINSFNGFARKNYFYGDLPKGYQITQDKTPICTQGKIAIRLDDNQTKTIRLQRIHMEEDAGKSIHDLDPYNTLIDLNRAGTPLIEIVTEPDLSSPEEAYAYLQEIRKLVRHLGICDGNMEEGSLRCDANISIRPKGSTTLGERAEVKNMNSMRHVMKAISYEAKRQLDCLDAGQVIHQETRSFKASDGSTFSLRTKEAANDYRYFPEPDLPPVVLKDAEIEAIKSEMPELPAAMLKRYTEQLGLSLYDAEILTEDKHFSAYFDEVIKQGVAPKPAANWLLGPIKSWLNEKALTIHDFVIDAKKTAQTIALIESDTLSFAAASQRLFPAMVESPEASPEDLAKSLGIIQSSDEAMIQEHINAVLAQFSDKVEAYKNGKKGLLGLFMGQVMKRTGGKANPKLTNQLLRKKLEE